MKEAVVTGYRGFIGRHISRALYDAGWEVTGIDTQEGKKLGIHNEHWADARDYFAHKYHQPDLLIHCAASDPYRQAIDKRPAAVGPDNLSLDAELFRWADRMNPGHIVYISSSAAYPILYQDGCPPWQLTEGDIDLSNPKAPDAIYGWTKLTGERMAADAMAAGISVSVVRPFSGYGEDQSVMFPFGAFVGRARCLDNPFKIWGSGEQVRDWVHVDDIVNAILRIVDLRHSGPVNIGTGIGTSMRDLVGLITRARGYEPEISLAPSAPSGVAYRVCEPSRLLAVYNPRISIQEGVARAFA